MQRKSMSHFAYITARELVNVPLEMQFKALVVVAKQCKLDDTIKITKHSITATQSQYDLLVRRLIECIYQN
jgi:hypothetical protein